MCWGDAEAQGLCLQGSVPDALGKDSLLRNDLKTALAPLLIHFPYIKPPRPPNIKLSHSVVYDNILGSI